MYIMYIKTSHQLVRVLLGIFGPGILVIMVGHHGMSRVVQRFGPGTLVVMSEDILGCPELSQDILGSLDVELW